MIEERRGQGHYQGRSAGVSIPVGSIAGRPVRYRVGASRGHFVQGAPSPTAKEPTTIHYGPALSGAFDLRLDLALAHFRGTAGDLVRQLQAELAHLDVERPAAPVGAQG